MLRNSVKSVTLFLQQDQPYNQKQNKRTMGLYQTAWRHIYVTSGAIIYGFISHIKSTEHFVPCMHHEKLEHLGGGDTYLKSNNIISPHYSATVWILFQDNLHFKNPSLFSGKAFYFRAIIYTKLQHPPQANLRHLTITCSGEWEFDLCLGRVENLNCKCQV